MITNSQLIMFEARTFRPKDLQDSVSIRIPLFSAAKMLLPASVSLKIASITDNSVEVVS
jgi:hypothetical protein